VPELRDAIPGVWDAGQCTVKPMVVGQLPNWQTRGRKASWARPRGRKVSQSGWTRQKWETGWHGPGQGLFCLGAGHPGLGKLGIWERLVES